MAPRIAVLWLQRRTRSSLRQQRHRARAARCGDSKFQIDVVVVRIVVVRIGGRSVARCRSSLFVPSTGVQWLFERLKLSAA